MNSRIYLENAMKKGIVKVIHKAILASYKVKPTGAWKVLRESGTSLRQSSLEGWPEVAVGAAGPASPREGPAILAAQISPSEACSGQ